MYTSAKTFVEPMWIRLKYFSTLFVFGGALIGKKKDAGYLHLYHPYFILRIVAVTMLTRYCISCLIIRLFYPMLVAGR